MKLLLDQNLSRRLLPDLEPHFPGSSRIVAWVERSEAQQAAVHEPRPHVGRPTAGFAQPAGSGGAQQCCAKPRLHPASAQPTVLTNQAARHKLLAHVGEIHAFLASDDQGVLEIE